MANSNKTSRLIEMDKKSWDNLQWLTTKLGTKDVFETVQHALALLEVSADNEIAGGRIEFIKPNGRREKVSVLSRKPQG